ncbi:MAG: FAD-dependent oxidoreductase [Armatimonadota bacterium]
MRDVIYDVAIVGGGLAGLSAAVQSSTAGLKTILLEASDDIGGKLRTDRDEQGFQYDRGFQVCFTGYEELKHFGNWSAVPEGDWQFYSSGATIAGMGTLSKWNLLRSLTCKAISPIDLPRLLSLNLRARKWESESTSGTVREFLLGFGFSESTVERFFAPFYGGISLDRTLGGSSRQFLKTWHFLSIGRTATFSGGISGLVHAIDHAWAFDDPNTSPTVEVNRIVTRLNRVDDIYAISADTEYLGRSVVIAGGHGAVAQLLGQTQQTEYKQSICLYFASNRPVTKEKYIILNPAKDALINQLVPLSNVNPACTPKGKHLCSATIIGDWSESDEELAQMAINEMNTWGMNLPPLEFKKAYRIKEAQLLQEPGFEDRVPSIETHLPGVFLAGEMTTSSSINDALKSGRLAAEAALAYLKNK